MIDAPSKLCVISSGEARDPDMSLFPSASRSAVRYADELAWTAATAAAKALGHVQNLTPLILDATGVIATCACAPAATIAALAEATAAGSSSPMRYPASNAGAIIGVTAIVHRLHGPTMNFIMPPEKGLPVAMLLAEQWLSRLALPMVLLMTCRLRAPRKYEARCSLLGAENSHGSTSESLEAIEEWLAALC